MRASSRRVLAACCVAVFLLVAVLGGWLVTTGMGIHGTDDVKNLSLTMPTGSPTPSPPTPWEVTLKPTAGPALTLKPTAGPPGTTVHVEGSGYSSVCNQGSSPERPVNRWPADHAAMSLCWFLVLR
jgi:hypothetical protein